MTSSDLYVSSQKRLCDRTCSLERLGDYTTVATQGIRKVCREICQRDGRASFLCSKYCEDFPDDDACATLKSSTVPPTISQDSLTLLGESVTGPVLSISQLELGFHGFLGYTPHEQLGVHMRNPSK